MKLLVLTAMDVEEQSLLAALEGRVRGESTLPAPFPIKLHEAQLPNAEVYLAATGIGLTHAAMASALCVAAVKPDLMLMVGVAGALAPDLAIGDVVVAAQVLQYDSLYVSAKGSVPMRPGTYISRGALTNAHFTMSKPLVELAATLETARPGTLLSGAEFSALPARKSELKERHPDALAIDMEAAAFAQVAAAAKVPALVIKTISDRLTPPSQSVLDDYVDHVKAACAKAASASFQLLNQIDQSVLTRCR